MANQILMEVIGDMHEAAMRELYRNPPEVRRIFLSHAHADGKRAVLIADLLQSAYKETIDVVCTSRPSDRIMSEDVARTLVERIKTSQVLLSLLSETGTHSPWVYYEMGAARALGVCFIPCLSSRLGWRNLPPQASDIKAADLSHKE